MTITNILASCEQPEPEGFTLKDLAEGTKQNGGAQIVWGKRVIVTPIHPVGIPSPSIDLNDIKNRRFGKQ